MTADDAKESLTTEMMLPLNSYVGEVQNCLDATTDMFVLLSYIFPSLSNNNPPSFSLPFFPPVGSLLLTTSKSAFC